MYKMTLIASAACLALTGAASAAVINFDESDGVALNHGDLVTMISSVDGTVTANVSVDRREVRPVRFLDGDARIFDTTLARTSDDDLEDPFQTPSGAPLTVVQGNVLIIDERSRPNASTINFPDDNGQGGVITFDFLTDVFFSGVTFIDDGSLEITGFLNGTGVYSGTIDNGRLDNTLTALSISAVTVDKLVFNFGSNSGAIDDVLVSAVPLPAGAALMLTGLAGLGFARRRRAQA